MYDETFLLDWNYDSTHPGAEILEACLNDNGTFTNVTVSPTTGETICIIPPIKLPIPSVKALATKNAEYLGVQT